MHIISNKYTTTQRLQLPTPHETPKMRPYHHHVVPTFAFRLPSCKNNNMMLRTSSSSRSFSSQYRELDVVPLLSSLQLLSAPSLTKTTTTSTAMTALPLDGPFSDLYSSDFWEPIYLSSFAGASTCLGASVVFLLPTIHSFQNRGAADKNKELFDNEKGEIDIVGPGLLSFSLALAGSVMITVCLISILPECLAIDGGDDKYAYIGFASDVFLRRGIGFLMGWGVYALLSRLLSNLPEEDEWGELLGNAFSTTDGKLDVTANHLERTGANVYGDQMGNADTTKATYSSVHVFGVNQSSLSMSVSSPQSPTITNTITNHQSSVNVNNRIPSESKQSSWRLTLLLFLSLLLHNFPEGIAVAFAAASSANENVQSTSSSLASIVTLSIALHNIPEGIAIAVPCLKARPNQPWLAFGLASLSGLAEPIGAFAALTMLRLRENGVTAADAISFDASGVNDMGDALAFVAGIMMAVAICELFPEAERQRKECDDSDPFAWGIAIGVCVMVTTELYLG